MTKSRIYSIVGARPNFIKLAALSPELRKVCNETIIHTGQHYDYEMNKVFFDEMGIPEPDYHLDVRSGTHGYQTGIALARIDSVLEEVPDAVIVYGDTNSTLAGALAAVKRHIPVIHIESGCRSFDRRMPEEINRVLVDRIAIMLFCSLPSHCQNLEREGIPAGYQHCQGDVMADLMQKNTSLPVDIPFDAFNLLTIHREENATPAKISAIFNALKTVDQNFVFPVHPRITKLGINYPENFFVTKPVGYFQMRWLEEHAERIVTDSGGVQKEAYMLHKPCVTLRNTTEWMETLCGNWNIKAATNEKTIRKALLIQPDENHYRPYLFGKPGVCKRIAKTIAEELVIM